MVRDYTSETYDRLTNIILDIDSNETNWLTDIVGDILITFVKWLKLLNIEDYEDELDKYHKYVLDQHDTTILKLHDIFEAVSDVDTSYCNSVKAICDDAAIFKDEIAKLASQLDSCSDLSAPEIAAFVKSASDAITSAKESINSEYSAQHKIRSNAIAGDAAKELAFGIVSLTVTILASPYTVGIKSAGGDVTALPKCVWKCFNGGIALGADIRTLGMLAFSGSEDDPWDDIETLEDADKQKDVEDTADFCNQLYEMTGAEWLHVAASTADTLDLAVAVSDILDIGSDLDDSILDKATDKSLIEFIGFVDPNKGVDELNTAKTLTDYKDFANIENATKIQNEFCKLSGHFDDAGHIQQVANVSKIVGTVTDYTEEFVDWLRGDGGNGLNVVFDNNDVAKKLGKNGVVKLHDYIENICSQIDASKVQPIGGSW